MFSAEAQNGHNSIKNEERLIFQFEHRFVAFECNKGS